MKEENIKNQEVNYEEYVAGVKDESIAFENGNSEKTLTRTRAENVRRRKDGYFSINIETIGEPRTAIVPEDTLKRLVKEGTSFRPLKDRYNTLSTMTSTFEKPLMYYAIVAYNKVPKEKYEKWNSSKDLLPYELIHLNGNIDDIRKENVRLTYKDIELWEKIKKKYVAENKEGADLEYARRREEMFKNKLKEYPDLKIMVRVVDTVRIKNRRNKQEYDATEII